MNSLPREQHEQRRIDVEWALARGGSFSDLMALWMVSKVAVWHWCQRHCTEEEARALAANGRTKFRLLGTFRDKHPVASILQDRLELIALTRAAGWSDSKLARAMGVTPEAICEWLRRNAPDGLQDALSDYLEEEAA